MAMLTNPTTLNVLASVAASQLAREKDISSGPHQEASEALGLPLNESTRISHDDDDEDDAISPLRYLEQLFARYGIRFKGRRRSLSRAAVPRPSFEEVDAYSIETALAVRQGDLDKLKELYYDKGFSLSACNRFGESLLHICCRRGHAKMVAFMMTEAQVNPRVIDDMGRTAFHDVCWSSDVLKSTETMDVLLSVLPPIGLLMQDCRGHTPLHYVRQKHWGLWLEYLQEREHIFVNWIREKRERAASLRKQAQMQAQIQARAKQPQALAPRVVEMSPSA